ncbi:MAG: cmk [Pseudonocardiales bacterium]|nr:cmk [Pseudonocardiales bacterium]
MPEAPLVQPLSAVVALDGPSGTGKSTVARTLARRLGARYLDTGAMYRAATAMVLRAGVDPADADAVRTAVAGLVLDISTDPDDQAVRVGDIDVTEEIRGPEVTTAVSPVSAIAEVRAQLVAQQRALIGAGGIVVEGRDIASVVWPQAELKVYLTASPEVRAARRAGELVATGNRENLPSVAEVALDLARRDTFDSSRAASPLMRADGALELDTSDLDINGVVEELIRLLAVESAN